MRMLFFFSLAFVIGTLNPLQGATWKEIDLPNEYIVPPSTKTNVYSAQLPTSPLVWTETPDCNSPQSPSIHWKSDLNENIKGISFKGLVFKLPELKGQGSPLNAFAAFFHEHACYTGGSEYGWFFKESDLPQALFYISTNSNLNGQQIFLTWPGDHMHVIKGNKSGVEKALKNSGIYRYWNILITPQGNFTLQLIDPSTYYTVSVTLEKPSWFPNLYDVQGYMTITAKKQAQTNVLPAPYMHADDVRIFQ